MSVSALTHPVTSKPLGTKAGLHAIPQNCDSGWNTVQDICALLHMPTPKEHIDMRFQRRRVKAGHWLFGAGEEFTAVYLVYSGFLKTALMDEFGNEQILGFPMKGDLLGVDGLHAARYASQAAALTDCEVVVIPFRELARLGHECAELENWVFRAVSRELVREYGVVGLLGALGAEARVARFLVSLSDRFAALGFSPKKFILRMTRQEIGSYLGMTLETVSRSLSALDAAGLIAINQRAVELRDVLALRTMQRPPVVEKSAASVKAPARVARGGATGRQSSGIWASLAIA